MMRVLTRMLAVLFVACVLFDSASASAQQRFALVIGNSNYQAVQTLPNAVHDATAVSDFLKSAGFDVTTALDVDQSGLRHAVQDFAQRVGSKDDPKTVALIYFAGHGVQVDGENYLVPVDAKITSAADIPFAAVRFNDVMNTLEQIGKKTRLIFLDACRDNPFNQGALAHGLAIVSAPTGTLVVYSTSPGATAEDGSGANSPFTTALLETGKKPGESIEETIKDMRVAVSAQTTGRQVPWDVSSLIEPFSFFPDANATPPKPVLASATTSDQPAAPPAEPTAAAWRERLRGISADDAHKVALREDRVVVYQVVIDLFPRAPFTPELRNIVKRRIEMWAWLDAVNLNSVAGYQAFQKLYGNDDISASATHMSGRLRAASGNEAPDALGTNQQPLIKTVVRDVSDCGGGGGAAVRPRPVSVPITRVPYIRPVVRPPPMRVSPNVNSIR
ncbi:MAG TPA: caspase family protein [Xanthobacteraceae bacterium]|nr:caspase family protein [Xanthobacteraceae bacterium]